jgi:hypothetical protein
MSRLFRPSNEQFSEKWFEEIKPIAKLRQKGSTMLTKLPRGVFRCILENYLAPINQKYTRTTSTT